MTLQEEIDGIIYPPTHTYQLEGLAPSGLLKERVEIIEREFPNFFSSGHLLDVGCNKGFFSLYHKGEVTGIDPDETCIILCRKLAPSKMFHTTTFAAFPIAQTFDKIFIGNGQHYPFIEAKGWSWVFRLAHFCHTGTEVLLEGPVSMVGVDAQRCIPDNLVEDFTRVKLLEAFDECFTLNKITPSPIVDRFFLFFTRRTEKDTYAQYLKKLYQISLKYTLPTDVILEICTREDRGILGTHIIPHKEYLLVDKDEKRPGLNLDAVIDELPASDVTISTAIFHHTRPEDIEKLFHNLMKNTRRTIIISGPADDRGVELYGDHLYHLNREQLKGIAQKVGWEMVFNRRIDLEYGGDYEFFLVFTKGDG